MSNITGGSALLDIKLILNQLEITEKNKIADLGCGSSGHFIIPIARLIGKNGKVYAVDILKPILVTLEKKIKQENLTNIETIWSNLEISKATKIDSDSLDIVLLINTLYLSSKRKKIIHEAIRMMKKGAQLLIVDWKNSNLSIGPPAQKRVKIDLLKFFAEKLSLQLKNEFDAGEYHFGLLFIKT